MKTMIRSRQAVLLILFCAAFLGEGRAERPPILAGSATLSITPDPSTHNIPLGGYGAREGKPATGVRDPVIARTLYLQQGETKVALVACDLVFIPGSLAEAVRYRLQAGQMDDVQLFLAATHSHAAPE